MKKLIIMPLFVFTTGLVAQRELPPKQVPPFKSVNSVNLIEEKPTLEFESEGLLAQVLALLEETIYPLPVEMLNLLYYPRFSPEFSLPKSEESIKYELSNNPDEMPSATITQTSMPGLANHNESVFECPKCKALFTTPSHLKRHRNAVHKKKEFQCPQCEKKFNDPSNLRQHQKFIHEKKGKCPHCNMILCSKLSLEKHRAVKHPKDNIGIERPSSSRPYCHQARKQINPY